MYLLRLWFGAIAAPGGSHAAAGSADNPRGEALDDHQNFAVPGDDGFTFAASDGAEDLADSRGCRHDEPVGDGLLGLLMEGAAIVDAANVGVDEARTDERDLNAVEGEFGGDGIGESADGEYFRPETCCGRRDGSSPEDCNQARLARVILNRLASGVERARANAVFAQRKRPRARTRVLGMG